MYYKKIIALSVLMTGVFYATGQCRTRTGGSGSWGDASTWSRCGGGVPSEMSAGRDITIRHFVVSTTTDFDTLRVGNLTIESGGTLLMNALGPIFIDGTLTIKSGGQLEVYTNGTIIFGSSVVGSLLVMEPTATLKINGALPDLTGTGTQPSNGLTIGTTGSIQILDQLGLFTVFDVTPTSPTAPTHLGSTYNVRRRASGNIIINRTPIISRPWDPLNKIFTHPSPARRYSGRASNVLPVELMSFTVAMQRYEVMINWTTLTEFNNDYFEVAHSIDGAEWTNLTQVKGAGTTNMPQNYSFQHGSTAFGINYYRLTQTDYDGIKKVVSIANILNKGKDDLVVYPNPSDGLTTIHAPGEGKITITDLTGREIANMQCETSRVSVELPNGLYIVKFEMNGYSLHKRVVVR